MTIAVEDRDPRLKGPLEGVRIIEMGQLLAGPFATSRSIEAIADFLHLLDRFRRFDEQDVGAGFCKRLAAAQRSSTTRQRH